MCCGWVLEDRSENWIKGCMIVPFPYGCCMFETGWSMTSILSSTLSAHATFCLQV
jgi:hypothetical protein